MKKKYLLLVLLFSFFSINSISQNSTDIEFKRLNDLCRQHQRTPDSLLFYSQQLLEFSQKNNLVDGQKSAYKSLGFAYSRLRNYEKSNQYYYKALTLAKKNNDERLKYMIYNDLALNHRATQYYDSAFYYFRKMLDYNNVVNDNKLLSVIYMNMGVTFFRKSELDSAEIYLNKSIGVFSKEKNIRQVSNTLSVLGEVYFQKENYKTALIIADSCQTLSESINNKTAYSRNYNLLARIHKKLDNPEASEKYTVLAFENMPKNIEANSMVPINDKRAKSRYQQNIKHKEDLLNDKLFYKSNLFKILAIAICLVVVSLYLYRKNKISQKEVLLLQEQLDLVKENKTIKPVKLIHLKSKAVIDTNNLLYIKSDGHYLEFYCNGKNKPEIDRNTMTAILEILPSNQFVRTHKSFIVNINHIKIINSTKLMLTDGKWINLSRTYKQQLKDILLKD